ncbi:TetR/AcrR family transcriptional regulator [Asaia krungthepensis]|uniref:TetR family transcriptional regulator n=1 Tax=Asaia krungthepensis NRIC 0535 TaxID=1307925 RepID=A0ABQ0Q505_9PROT|nr:TetR/AcrR family transcriptional regulator [Asaia krungthepensis]GBQ91652.1 TetR family transcriptional regulator [Asaia krungthepensis NRIC 0535]
MTRKIDLKERLLEIATECLENGDHDPSLRDIAKRAGVSPMAPYRHFPDKAALLGAVVINGFEKLRLVLEEADKTQEGRASLIAQGVAYVLFARDNPALFALMFSEEKTGVVPSELGGGYAVLSRRIETLRGRPDPLASLGSWSLVHGLAVLQRDKKLDLAVGQIEAVLELMTRGVA